MYVCIFGCAGFSLLWSDFSYGERGILSSYGAWACYCGNLSPAAPTPEHGEFSSSPAQSELPRAMWSLPGPGIKPVSLPLQGDSL